MNLCELVGRHLGVGAGNGAHGTTTRLAAITRDLLPRCPGHVVEIGVGAGVTTQALLPFVTAPWRYLAIDPFAYHDGVVPFPPDEAHPYSFTNFTRYFGDHPRLDLCRAESASEQARQAIAAHQPLALAFVDGLITEDAILSDCLAVQGAHIICVGDALYPTNRRGVTIVLPAIRRFMELAPYVLIATEHEAYLVHREHAPGTP